jgi:SAM-dependent methyltransferase
MSETDRQRWNERYRSGAYADRCHPSALLEAWLRRVTPPDRSGQALDLACGLGRNALALARAGWRVDAVDISDVALGLLAARARSEGLPIRCRRVDVEQAEAAGAFEDGHYDLIIVFRYTRLALMPVLIDALAPGGHLIVELHLESGADVVGPKDARFRVAPGALAATAVGLQVLASEEGVVRDPDGRNAALARLVARRPPAAAGQAPGAGPAS